MKPTTDEVLAWAREAGLYLATDVHWMPIIGLNYLEKATALAYAAGAAAMKERAAKECEETKDKSGVNDDGRTWLERATKHDCAKAIRALGDDDE